MWDELDDIDWPVPEYFPPSPRREGLNKLFEIYKREHERIKEYIDFENTMREIENLPESSAHEC